MSEKSIKAFPIQIENHTAFGEQGMDLRDYFAAKALQGMLSTAAAPWLTGLGGEELMVAHFAYKLADAMMEARKK